MRARPLPVTVAAVLLALFSLLNVIFPLLPTEGVPAFVVYLGVCWAWSASLLRPGCVDAQAVGCVAHHHR
jgi:hypothetical protein